MRSAALTPAIMIVTTEPDVVDGIVDEIVISPHLFAPKGDRAKNQQTFEQTNNHLFLTSVNRLASVADASGIDICLARIVEVNTGVSIVSKNLRINRISELIVGVGTTFLSLALHVN